MDAGAVLNALLARHSAYSREANVKGVLQKARRGDDVTTTSERPPAKVAEAVRRGVNPLLLNLNLNKPDAAARDKARRKRARAKRPPTAATKPATSPVAAAATAATSSSQKTETTSAASKTRKEALLPASRKVDQAREQVVSKTQLALHRELRRADTDEETRKRTRSASTAGAGAEKAHSPSAALTSSIMSGTSVAQRKHARAEETTPLPASNSSSATTGTSAKSRRAVWRRRCTTRKIRRLTRGVSRAAAVRRFWYTNLHLSTNLAQPSAALPLPVETPQKEEKEKKCHVRSAAPPAPKLENSKDVVEVRCAMRRRRAARRAVLASFHLSRQERTQKTAVTDNAQAGEVVSAPTAAAATAERLTRRRYTSDLRSALCQTDVCMWHVAVRLVAERCAVVRELTSSCAADTSGRDGVLPLLLARHFPLFGAAVEVQEVEVCVPPLKIRSTRHRRRARYTQRATMEEADSANEASEAGVGAAQLRMVQRLRGVVLEEYGASLGVLLLPSSKEGQAAWDECVRLELLATDAQTQQREAEKWRALHALQSMSASPRVVRVAKHFPAASGTFSELLPQLLAATPRHDARDPSFVCTRARIVVFCGEVDPAAATKTQRSVSKGEAPPVPGSAPYPLKRMQNRCL